MTPAILRTLIGVITFSLCSCAHLDDGKVLQTSEQFTCDKRDCIFKNEYHEDLEIYEGWVQLRVLYDNTGPYLAMNLTVQGSGTVTDVRYAVSIQQLEFQDEIVYRGDHGYDFCCRFLSGVSCSWKGKTLTPDTPCSLDSFSGSVSKPLHHHRDGPWSAKLILYSRGEELGYVEMPFNVSVSHLGQIVSLKKLWESPYGNLVIAAPQNSTSGSIE